MDGAVAEALGKIEQPHAHPVVVGKPQNRGRRGSSLSVSSMAVQPTRIRDGGSLGAWDVSRLVRRRSSAAERDRFNSNKISPSSPTSSKFSDDGEESNFSDDELPSIQTPSNQVPLSLINGLIPLISNLEIDEREVKPLNNIELDKLASLQRDLAALLIKHSTNDADDDTTVTSTSSSASSTTVGPLNELIASLRTVGLKAADLPEAYSTREPSSYEVALIDELMAAQVSNRKLKQKLQVIQHDPNMYHTVRYPSVTEVPVPPEYDPQYITQTSLRRRMAGEFGTDANLFDEGHDIIRQMRELYVKRSKDQELLGGLLGNKHVIIADAKEAEEAISQMSKAGEGSSDADGTSAGAGGSKDQKASTEDGTDEAVQLRDECKTLRIRLEEIEADRGEFDQLSLNVQMLRETLRTKNAAMQDLQQDNHELRKQLDEVIHEYRKQQIVQSFPDKQVSHCAALVFVHLSRT